MCTEFLNNNNRNVIFVNYYFIICLTITNWPRWCERYCEPPKHNHCQSFSYQNSNSSWHPYYLNVGNIKKISGSSCCYLIIAFFVLFSGFCFCLHKNLCCFLHLLCFTQHSHAHRCTLYDRVQKQLVAIAVFQHFSLSLSLSLQFCLFFLTDGNKTGSKKHWEHFYNTTERGVAFNDFNTSKHYKRSALTKT